ncbi:MAG: WxcM-like domain-containing protein [Candidatus Brocadiales bacterium]|nr:WxcM-like domain-containing protein [Candidatus Brocadiales bacterium]
MNLIKIIDLPSLGDERGSLIALESNDSVPFDIKRVYYLFGTKKGIARGFHAHKALKQLAVCVSGNCRFVLDNGLKKQDIVLDSPLKGLIIDKMIWHEMYDFSDDCVLMVLADEVYDEVDYIRDYEDFLDAIR